MHAIGDGERLLVVLEGGDGDEGAEDLFLADAIGRLGPHDGGLDEIAIGEVRAVGLLAAGDDLAALVLGDLGEMQHAFLVLLGRQRPISVVGSSGSPSLIDWASLVKPSRNSSAMDLCRMRREPAIQAWP